MTELRQTRFSDVCGSLDELKRQLREEQAPDPQGMVGLLEDVGSMLERMERRLREYADFEQEAETFLDRIRSLGPSRLAEARSITSRVSVSLERGKPAAENVEAVCAQLEQVRAIANDQEQKLRRGREAAIGSYRLYVSLRGKRDWSVEEGASISAADRETELVAQWGSWLPPSPHRERILDYLARGRAYVLPPDGARKEPYVDFEDGGGGMPLRQVRWSDSVRNFYPAGQEPHPGAWRHRGQ